MGAATKKAAAPRARRSVKAPPLDARPPPLVEIRDSLDGLSSDFSAMLRRRRYSQTELDAAVILSFVGGLILGGAVIAYAVTR